MDSIGDLSALWQIILNNIRDERAMPATAIDLWFGNLQLTSLSTDTVVFATDSVTKKNIIQSKYTAFLSEHIENVICFTPDVEIVVDSSLANKPANEDGIRSPLELMRRLKAERGKF